MKELFRNLIEPTQRNEISTLNSFKLWLVFSFYFLFYNCLFFAFLRLISFVPTSNSLLLEKVAFFFTYIASLAYELNLIAVSFIFTVMGTKMHLLPQNLLPIRIVFPSTQYMFVFSVLIWGVLHSLSSIGGNAFIFCITMGKTIDKILPNLSFILIAKFIASLFGFFIFRKMLQLGWCGVIVEKEVARFNHSQH